MAIKDPIYERDPAISDGNQLYIRASATDLCSRMLYYSAKGVPKTDDTPPDTQVMFDLGNYLEAFVKDTMAKHHGWTFQGFDPYTVYMPISQSSGRHRPSRRDRYVRAHWGHAHHRRDQDPRRRHVQQRHQPR